MKTYFRICKKILAPLLATLFISGCSLVVYLPISSSQLNILKTSSVSSNLFSVVADGASNSIITVTLFDKNGVPLVGKILSLSSSRGATDTIGAASGSSNASGVVTFNVTSTTTGVTLNRARTARESRRSSSTAVLPEARRAVLPSSRSRASCRCARSAPPRSRTRTSRSWWRSRRRTP